MPSDPSIGPSTPPEQRKANVFATWAKGAAPLIAALGAFILGLINIYKKPAEPVAAQSYKELSAQVEKVSAITLANHDDNVSLRAWVAARLGEGIPVTSMATPSASARAPVTRLPAVRSASGGGRPALISSIAASVASAEASSPDAGTLVALILPEDNLKPLPPVSPRPVQYKAKPVGQVQQEAEKAAP